MIGVPPVGEGEAIPIASKGGIKVVVVNYRKSPGAGYVERRRSSYWTLLLNGLVPLTATDEPGHRIVSDTPYFNDADLKDPLIAPL
ncbi:MAG: hypothetical protein JWM91_5162 [Rhodospirillales bacterium]|nr:hypothetical protein [Rhodospirillales bacterium]